MQSTLLKTIEYKGWNILVHYDSDPRHPRTDFDNLTIMACAHRRYNLGDQVHAVTGDYESWQEIEATIKKREKVELMKPLYLYDHSGLTISTSPFGCGCDSGRIGTVYITREAALKNFGVKRLTKKHRETLEKLLDAEVKTYDQYLRGEIYGYVLKHPLLGERDSCWGFYDEKYMLSECRSIIDSYLVEGPEDIDHEGDTLKDKIINRLDLLKDRLLSGANTVEAVGWVRDEVEKLFAAEPTGIPTLDTQTKNA